MSLYSRAALRKVAKILICRLNEICRFALRNSKLENGKTFPLKGTVKEGNRRRRSQKTVTECDHGIAITKGSHRMALTCLSRLRSLKFQHNFNFWAVRGFASGVHFESLLRGDLFRGFVSTIRFESLLRGFATRVHSEGSLRRFVPRVPRIHFKGSPFGKWLSPMDCG